MKEVSGGSIRWELDLGTEKARLLVNANDVGIEMGFPLFLRFAAATQETLVQLQAHILSNKQNPIYEALDVVKNYESRQSSTS